MSADLQIVFDYFPELSSKQRERLATFAGLIIDWNQKINLIARTDIDNLAHRHILHSLAIAKVIEFKSNTSILDVGTGGGFPGIPLAILYPDCRFHLIDSIGKKIKIVQDCVEKLDLQNATAEQIRAENVDRQFDFIIARAVTQLPKFMNWIRKKVKRSSFNALTNGVLYLKGGDLTEEFESIKEKPTAYPIQDFFQEDEYQEKYVIHIPVKRWKTNHRLHG